MINVNVKLSITPATEYDFTAKDDAEAEELAAKYIREGLRVAGAGDVLVIYPPHLIESVTIAGIGAKLTHKGIKK